MHLHFICSGAIGVYEKREQNHHKADYLNATSSSPEEPTQQRALYRGDPSANGPVLLNLYHPGQSLGDPEINFRTPVSSQVCVTENNTKVVSLSRESFYQVYANKMNSMVLERK